MQRFRTALKSQARTAGSSVGKPEKAVEYLEKAIEIEKNNGDVRIHMAEALLALKKPAEAKKHLDHVLQMKPHPEYLPEYEKQVAKVKKMLESNF